MLSIEKTAWRLATAGVFAMVGLMAWPALAQDRATVAVTAIVEHPALEATRDGLRDALAEHGYVVGENLEFVYQTAQGNPATAAQIARHFVGLNPSVMVPISTPSAQAIAAATDELPIVFTAVTDPIGAQLLVDPEAPGGNITGLSDMSPLADHLDLMREFLPEAEVIGVPHNPGEANSVTLLNALTDMAPDWGFTVVVAVAPRSADVLAAAQTLAGQADLIYVANDNTVGAALEAVLAVGHDANVPVFAGDNDSVVRGAIASVGYDYYQVGQQTAGIVARVLDGEDPGSIPVSVAAGTDLFVNPAAAEAMGVEVPRSVIERANRIVQ